jgi:protein SOK2
MLYPLFVHNIGALLYHPTNQARQSIGNAAMAARRPEQGQEYMRTPQGTQPPSLTHHHSMSNPIGASVPQPPHSIAPHPASGRPGLDRAHTFPTPPASASSLTMGMGHAGSSYEYGGAQAAPMHPGQPLSIDTGLNARSMPTTPASTPPGNSQGVQYQTSQPYDSSRQMYSAPSSHPGYPSQQHLDRYGGMHSSPEAKTQMGPPARAGAENQHYDSKAHPGYASQHDAEGEHEGEYTHTSASYGARRPSYSYKPNPAPGPIHSDPNHVSPEMTHSPHQNGSGRATPRTANPYTGYASTPQRAAQLPSSNLSYGMNSDTRAGAPNGPEPYPAHGYQTPQYASMNGAAPPSNKRMREIDDEQDPYGRPSSAGGDGLKRQRTDPGVRPISQPHSVKTGPMRR